MNLRGFLLRGYTVAARMVNAGLDEYTLYVFLSERDMADMKWHKKIVHKNLDWAIEELDEIRVLRDDLFVTTDFESLV